MLSQDLCRRISQLIDKHGTLKDFIVKFNPTYQHEICADSNECYFGDYPTLGLIRTAYGNNAPSAWIVPHLFNLTTFCGCRDKFTEEQYEELAYVISSEFSYLKVSELMLFFHRFKAGRYGRFYGSIDPMVITTSIYEFIRERSNAIEQRDREEASRQIEEGRKNSISWEEYCKNHGIEDKQNPLDRIREIVS